MANDRRGLHFIVEHLYAAPRLRDRVLWPVHRWTRGAWLPALAGRGAPDDVPTGISAIDPALIATVLRGVLPERTAEISWIHQRDYPHSRRDRALVFVFAGDQPDPIAVVKCGAASASQPLARERDVLRHLRARIPARLARTLPAPLAYAAASGREALALTYLPGRPAYLEVQTTMRPAALARSHLEAAADWLARFHEATARDAEPLAPVAAHGDFWARNLLIARRRGRAEVAAVVDWEHGRDGASPFDDLFHFAASYGLNYPWRRYGRVAADAALHLTFIEPTRLGGEVRRSVARYCELRRIDVGLVRPRFRAWVVEQAQAESPQREAWCRVHETLGSTERCVFSG